MNRRDFMALTGSGIATAIALAARLAPFGEAQEKREGEPFAPDGRYTLAVDLAQNNLEFTAFTLWRQVGREFMLLESKAIAHQVLEDTPELRTLPMSRRAGVHSLTLTEAMRWQRLLGRARGYPVLFVSTGL